MKLNRDSATVIREQLEAVLKDLNDVQEVKYRLGRSTFDPSVGMMKFSIEAVVPGGLSETEAKYDRWVKDQRIYGRDVYALNEVFKVAGRRVKPVGLRRTKVIVQDVDTSRCYLIAKTNRALVKP